MKAAINENGKAVCPVCGKEHNISAEDNYILCFHDELIEEKYDDLRLSLTPGCVEKEIEKIENDTDFLIEGRGEDVKCPHCGDVVCSSTDSDFKEHFTEFLANQGCMCLNCYIEALEKAN